MSDHDGQEAKTPEQVRAEIEQTRARLADTVQAIQDKLNPQHLREQAVSSVRSATVGRVENLAEDAKWKVKGAGSDMLDTVKRNPVPAALAVIGLGWLFMESRGQSNRGYERPDSRSRERYERGRNERGYYERGRYEDRGFDRGWYGHASEGQYATSRAGYYGEAYDPYASHQEEWGQREGVRERAGQAAGQAKERVQYAAQRTGEKAGQAVDTAKEGVQNVAQAVGSGVSSAASTVGQGVSNVASTVGEGVQTVAHTARHGVRQAAYGAREGAQTVAEQAQYGAHRVKSQFGALLEERPLVVGVAALALGAAIGMALPATEKENELLGEARDKVVERAQETVSEGVQKAQHVAREAGSAAKEAAKSEIEKQKAESR